MFQNSCRYTLLVFLIFFSIQVFSQNFFIPANDDTIKITPHLVGFNNQMASKNEPWTNNDYIRALQKTEVGLLRYPGGSVSNYWDMENDRLFKNAVEIDTNNFSPRIWLKTENVIGWVVPMWPAVNSISNLRLAYNAMASSNDAEPAIVFVLNMITPGADYYTQKWQRKVNETPLSDDWWMMMNDRLKRNIDMLDAVLANGMKVQYAEFGNEYYFGQSRAGDGANGGAIVEPYSAGAANTSLVGAFPGTGKSYADAVNHWADSLKQRYPEISLSAIAADANGTSPTRRNSWNTEVVKYIDKELVPAVSIHLYGGVDEGNLITTEENLGKAFASWKEHWEWKKKYSSFPTEREYWITEYNTNKDKQTWGHGLMNWFMIQTLLSEGKLGLSNYHQFAQNTINGSGIYASTRVLAMLARTTRGKTSAQQLTLNKDLFLEGTQEKVPALTGWIFNSPEETENTFFITNFSSKAVEIDISNIHDATGALFYSASTSLNNQSDPGIKTGILNNRHELAPASCMIFKAGGFLPVGAKRIQNYKTSQIRIFPNPGRNQISLELIKKQKVTPFLLEIYSVTGEQTNRFYGDLSQIESQINQNITNWETGIYLFKFKTFEHSQVIKWIKK